MVTRFATLEDGLEAEVANSTMYISLSNEWQGEEITVTIIPK